MIKIGDKVKIVSCKLCGGFCPGHPDFFEVIEEIQYPGKEFSYKLRVKSISSSSRGRICITRLRKVYD